MKKIYFLILSVTFGFALSAQTNLVPNPGFETASPCPDYPGQTNRATGWNNVNLNYTSPSVGTPDFFHACGSATLGYNCVPPNTFSGICSPHTGNGMMSIVVYNTPYPDYREYLATQLSSPMQIGNTYTVSFWITNGTTPYSPYTIKNIGVNFSTSPLSQSGWSLISLTPQCEITTQVGGTTWQQYTFTVSPTANWQHLTIGVFRTDGLNSPTITFSGTSGPPSVYARYYLDDISVIGIDPQGINEINSDYNDLSVYPNPTSGILNFSSSKPIDGIKISDLLGKEVEISQNNFENKTIDISKLNVGIYLVKFYHEGMAVSIKKFVKQN